MGLIDRYLHRTMEGDEAEEPQIEEFVGPDGERQLLSRDVCRSAGYFPKGIMAGVDAQGLPDRVSEADATTMFLAGSSLAADDARRVYLADAKARNVTLSPGLARAAEAQADADWLRGQVNGWADRVAANPDLHHQAKAVHVLREVAANHQLLGTHLGFIRGVFYSERPTWFPPADLN